MFLTSLYRTLQNLADRYDVLSPDLLSHGSRSSTSRSNLLKLPDHTTSWKVETSISEAKSIRIGAESLKIFPSRPEKWANGLSFFALEGRIEQQIRISARKRPRGPGLFETAVSSLDFVYRRLRQIPETPPPPLKTTKLAKWTTETRQGEFIYLNLFQKSNILFHCAILSFVILNSIQCLVECSNSQRPNV